MGEHMGRWHRRFRELRTVGLETIRPFASPFVSLIITTWSMVRKPVRFGEFVEEELGGLSGGLAYLAQAIVFLLVVNLLTFRWLVKLDPTMPDFPFVEVVITGGFVLLVLLVGFAFAPFFRLLAGRQLKIFPYVAASSYWVGLSVTLVSLLLLTFALVIGFFCEFGDGVARHCDGQSARVALQWPGLSKLTFEQLFFLVAWLALGLVLVAGTLAMITPWTWGFVCWLSRAHGASRLRVTLAILLLYICFAFLFFGTMWMVNDN